MIKLFIFLKTNKIQSFWIIIASFLINLLALSGALYVIQVFNKYINYKQDSTLLALTVGVLIAFSMELFLRITRNVIINKLSNIIQKKFSLNNFKKLIYLKIGINKISDDKDIMSLINPLEETDTNNVETLVSLIDILFIFIFLLVIAILSFKLAVISLLLAIVFTSTILFKKIIKKYFNRKLTILNYQVNSLIYDIKNIPLTVRAFNADDTLISKFRLYHARLRATQKSIKNMTGFFSSINIMIPVLSTIAIIFYGAQEVNAGTLSIGALVGINILNSRIFGPINRFSIYNTSVNSNSKEDFLVKNKEKIKYEKNDGLNPKIFKGDLKIKDLSLGFHSNKNILFQRLNCFLPSGSITVINGYNSSGKTSLCNSLIGLVEPMKGNILFDNIDIKNINIKNLRRSISFLPQNIELLNISIRENIRLNLDKNSSNYNNDGMLMKVINMVGLEGYINSLNKGINTIVENNGKNIPGGIKKRIGIARAIINEGKIVIFDEPTDSLDLEGVKKLYKILNDLRSLKKTIIIASHDQNIIKSAGIIIDLSSKPIPRIGVRKKN